MYAPNFEILRERIGSSLLTRLRRFRPSWIKAYAQPVSSKSPVRFHLASDTMTPRDSLLLFIALDGAPQGLDPIRLQKGMFLFAMDNGSDPGEVYDFVPYDYGPMSTQIYRDLDLLAERRLIDATPVEGQTWSRYSATDAGLAAAQDLMGEEPSQAKAKRLYAIKAEVSSHTYQQVLEDVYDRFPEFASKSVFRRAS
jgi:uncharacterized protein